MAECGKNCSVEETNKSKQKIKPKIAIDRKHFSIKNITSILNTNAEKQPTKKGEKKDSKSEKISFNECDKKSAVNQNSKSSAERHRSNVNDVDHIASDKFPEHHGFIGDSLKKNSLCPYDKNYEKISVRTDSHYQSDKNCRFPNHAKQQHYNTNYQKSNLIKSVNHNEVSNSNFKHENINSFQCNKNPNEKHSNSYRNKSSRQFANSPKKANISSPKLDVLNSEFVHETFCQSNSNSFGNYIFKTKDDKNSACLNSNEKNNSFESSVFSDNSSSVEDKEILKLSENNISDFNTSFNNIGELPDNYQNNHRHIEITSNNELIFPVSNSPEELVKNKCLNGVNNSHTSNQDLKKSILQSSLIFPPISNSQHYYADEPEPFIQPPISPSDPCISFTSLSSVANTSGYNSTSELDNFDYGKQYNEQSNFMSQTIDYNAISSFLHKKELESTKLTEKASKVLSDINRIVKYYFSDESVILYGSYLSELAVNNSNINLALKSNQSPSNSFFLKIRNKLYEEYDGKGYYIESYEDVKNKNVKISFYEHDSDISCELVYAGKTVEKAIKMNELLKTLCQYDTRVKTLIIASRIWAETCGILDSEPGKLHAIGYALLVVYFLQQLENPVLPVIKLTEEKEICIPKLKHENKASVGELWVDFLKFYNEEFKWLNYVVCITTKQKITKKSKSWEEWIAIEDPFSEKNIAATLKRDSANNIRSCFNSSYLYFSSTTSYSESDSETGDSYDGSERGVPKYSFASCTANLEENLPVCEECLEYGGVCGDCLKLSYVPEKIPEICQESLIYVDEVIHDIYRKNILSDDKIKGRIAFVKDLESYVRIRFPAACLSIFGSSVNGFGFEGSDIDICMIMPSDLCTYKNTQHILRGLRTHLRKDAKKRYKDIFCLFRATIPLIKFSSSEMGWKCDISLCNVLAVHNSKLLNTYAMFDVRCRELGCALKLLTKKGQIAECVSKSLSSYSYILMTIHYLQQIEPPVLPVFPVTHKEEFEKNRRVPHDVFVKNEWYSANILQLQKKYSSICKNISTIGELWLGLLDFYLNYDSNRAITITKKKPRLTSELQRTARLFNIEDPFLEEKNLGCIVSPAKAVEIMRIFRNARILFGSQKPKDVIDLKNHYFSSMNITGHYVKDMDCSFCGTYGHDKDSCRKLKFNRRRPLKSFPAKSQRY